MNWLIPALYNVVALSIYYFYLQGSKYKIPNDFSTHVVYGCSVLVMGGFFSILIFYMFSEPNKIHKLFYKDIYFIDILIPGLLAPTIIISNILALTNGGGIAISVVNLNMITILLVGAALYGDKINIKIIFGVLIGILSIGYAVNESIKIN